MSISLRPMNHSDWNEVAELIFLSTNHWYQTHGMNQIFNGDPNSAQLFCKVYEDLDPGCCIIATNQFQKIVGSCFFHPRATHISLGIMNVHPNYFGYKIASKLLTHIVDLADQENLPVRLVSSALNLDSFSLYNRAGFTPQEIYQDMYLQVPSGGLDPNLQSCEGVRPATLSDVTNIAKLEMSLAGIQREKDYRYFIENQDDIWKSLVCEDSAGNISGVLISVQHAASNMIGPGVAKDVATAKRLLFAQLQINAGRTPVVLIPSRQPELVKAMYGWGGRNCEIHFSQVRGTSAPPIGIVFPTFMPETG